MVSILTPVSLILISNFFSFCKQITIFFPFQILDSLAHLKDIYIHMASSQSAFCGLVEANRKSNSSCTRTYAVLDPNESNPAALET